MRGDRTGNTERSGQHTSCLATPQKSGSEVTHWLSRNSGGVRALPVKMKNWECTECGDGRLERSAHCGAARAFDSDRSHGRSTGRRSICSRANTLAEREREALRGDGGRTGFLFVWAPLLAIDTDPLQTTGALRTAVAPEPTSALWAARAACTVHA